VKVSNDYAAGRSDEENIYTVASADQKCKQVLLSLRTIGAKAKNSSANEADQSSRTVRYLVAVALDPFIHTPPALFG